MFQYISCYCSTHILSWSIKNSYVSIHLMLLFYLHSLTLHLFHNRFNTSHVTVLPLNHQGLWSWYICFNTSHVTVLPTYLGHFYSLSYHKPLIIQAFLKIFPDYWYILNILTFSHQLPTSIGFAKILHKMHLGIAHVYPAHLTIFPTCLHPIIVYHKYACYFINIIITSFL